MQHEKTHLVKNAIFQYREVYGKRSFTYKASHVWNTLSNELKKATTLNKFKALIKKMDRAIMPA